MKDAPAYQHTQRAPLCLFLYALPIMFFVLGVALRKEPLLRVVFPTVGLLTGLVAASFHYLRVKDQGDELSVSFGPFPLFRKTVRYSDIESIEIGRTSLLDGWGIHMSLQGGWVWNLWGRSCVVVNLRRGTLRIGTDDAEQLASFLEEKISRPRAVK